MYHNVVKITSLGRNALMWEYLKKILQSGYRIKALWVSLWLITGVFSLHRTWAQSWNKPETTTRRPRTICSTPRTSELAATSTRPCDRSVRATPSRGWMSLRPCRNLKDLKISPKYLPEGPDQQWFQFKCDVIAATPCFKDPGKHGADLCKRTSMSFI